MQCARLGAMALLCLKYKSAPKAALKRRKELYTRSGHQPSQASGTRSSSKQDVPKQEVAGIARSTALYIEINEYITSACKFSFFFNKLLNYMYNQKSLQNIIYDL